MECEIVDLMESLVADDAFVGLFHTVRQFVVLVVPLLMETFAAVLTHERLESGMNSDVRVEGGGTVESLTACGALVRLLCRVDDFVPAKSGRLPESFATDFTDEWTSARVNWHVPGQIVMRVKDFAAIRTGKDPALVVIVVSGG